jgi:hypothetical protein
MAPRNGWWPGDLGSPSSSGGQNDSSYAYFPGPRRLAINRNGQVTIYDTLDHQIGGVQQQQGGPSGSLSFSSQFGTFTVESLPIVSGAAPFVGGSQPNFSSSSGGSMPQPAPPPPVNNYAPIPPDSSATGPTSSSDVLGAIERLGQLAARGILTDEEFKAKKAELLSRL